MERTLVIFKPDALSRRLIGRILQRFEEKGLKIVGLKMTQVTRELAEKHYAEHRGKPFFEDLVQFITAKPVIVMVLEGTQAVQVVRKLMGATFGFEAEPGTIRGDFSNSKQNNLVHGSATKEDAEREIQLFFKEEELFSYTLEDEIWLR